MSHFNHKQINEIIIGQKAEFHPDKVPLNFRVKQHFLLIVLFVEKE